jgi:hypothetical protein
MAGTEFHLQLQLLVLERWCIKWDLKINVKKSNVVHFRRPRKKATKYVFKVNNQELEKEREYKYLGLIHAVRIQTRFKCRICWVFHRNYLKFVQNCVVLLRAQLHFGSHRCFYNTGGPFETNFPIGWGRDSFAYVNTGMCQYQNYACIHIDRHHINVYCIYLYLYRFLFFYEYIVASGPDDQCGLQ